MRSEKEMKKEIELIERFMYRHIDTDDCNHCYVLQAEINVLKWVLGESDEL